MIFRTEQYQLLWLQMLTQQLVGVQDPAGVMWTFLSMSFGWQWGWSWGRSLQPGAAMPFFFRRDATYRTS